jgi:hypothetical protein
MATKMKMKEGGIRSGVKDVKTGVKKINKGIVDKATPFAKAAVMATPAGALYTAGKAVAKKAKKVPSKLKALDDKLEKRYPNYTGKGSVYSKVKSKVKSLFGFQKGGAKKPEMAMDGVKKYQTGGSTISNKAKVALNKIKVNINKQNVNADKVNANKDKVTTNNRKVGFTETPKQAAARKKENYSNELNYQASKTYASKS